jgi:hypothetical protein
MTLDRALTWFIGAWLIFVLIFTVMSFAGMIVAAPTFWSGVAQVSAEPFNIKFCITLILFLSPALAAIWWRDKRRERDRTSN